MVYFTSVDFYMNCKYNLRLYLFCFPPAYETLTNPEKKKKYDMFGDGDSGAGHTEHHGHPVNFEEMFRNYDNTGFNGFQYAHPGGFSDHHEEQEREHNFFQFEEFFKEVRVLVSIGFEI